MILHLFNKSFVCSWAKNPYILFAVISPTSSVSANSSKEALKDQYKEEALKRIKFRLILEEIIKVEKIKVTDKEVEAEVEELAKKYNMTKEEVKKQYGENLDYIKYDLEVRKAFDIIKGE